MVRGDIYWVTLKKPDKKRPVLILTRNSAISEMTSVVVATITTTIRHLDSQVLLGLEDGMPKECVISLDNLHTVEKQHFGSYITHLPSEKMEEVFEALKFACGFED